MSCFIPSPSHIIVNKPSKPTDCYIGNCYLLYLSILERGNRWEYWYTISKVKVLYIGLLLLWFDSYHLF